VTMRPRSRAAATQRARPLAGGPRVRRSQAGSPRALRREVHRARERWLGELAGRRAMPEAFSARPGRQRVCAGLPVLAIQLAGSEHVHKEQTDSGRTRSERGNSAERCRKRRR
jgi:hypothetical protein